MIVKDIRQRIKINKIVSIASIMFAVITVISGLIFSYGLVQSSRKNIYVIDNGIPILAKQTDLLMNRPVEYKSQIDLFHNLFFTIPPDDDHIKNNIEKALYLIDDSGKKEYENLKEKGFYNQLISSSSMMSIKTDSITIDIPTQSFVYYGKQLINRRNSLHIRNLTTEGNFVDIQRTANNPHGVLLKNWRIIDNTELTKQIKYGR